MTNTSFQVKKFIANDITTAFQMVKSELGNNAVILSNEQIDGKVQILAAPQENKPESNSKPSPFIDHANQTASALMQLKKTKEQKAREKNPELFDFIGSHHQEGFTDTVISTKATPPKKGVEADTVYDLKAELSSIRKMMSVAYASQSWESFKKDNISQSLIYKKLLGIGFEPTAISDIISNLPNDMNYDDAWINVLNHLVHKIKLYKDHRKFKRLNLSIGPSGSGKTTILTKHLIEHIDDNNAHQYAVIFVNNNKLTTIHERQTFQNVFNVACFYVETIDELNQAYAECQDKKRIFLDLPALNFIEPEKNYFMSFIQQHQEECAVFGVVPANVSEHYLDQLLATLDNIELSGLSISKIDEYENYGACIGFAIENAIPIAYLNLSSELTEKLIDASYSLIMKDLLIIINNQNCNEIAIDEKMADFLTEKMTNEPAQDKLSKQSA